MQLHTERTQPTHVGRGLALRMCNCAAILRSTLVVDGTECARVCASWNFCRIRKTNQSTFNGFDQLFFHSHKCRERSLPVVEALSFSLTSRMNLCTFSSPCSAMLVTLLALKVRGLLTKLFVRMEACSGVSGCRGWMPPPRFSRPRRWFEATPMSKKGFGWLRMGGIK